LDVDHIWTCEEIADLLDERAGSGARLGRMHRLIAGLVLAGALAACSDAGTRGFTFDNQTDVTVSIVYATPQGEVVAVTSLAPENSAFIHGWPSATCGDMTLIARGPDGSEVARREGPTCLDDTWHVARPGPSN
jgi:hypothetical protein